MASKSSGVGEVVKWGAIGVGVYFLYRAFASSSGSGGFSLASLAQAVTNAFGGGGSPAATTTPVVTTTPPVTVTPVANESQTASALITAAGGVNSLDADQWNYYWSQISGVPQTADLFPPANRGALMDVNAYITARSAAGLPTTLPGLSGLGAATLPIPLMFAYSRRDKRPLLILPGGRVGVGR
jgi:hypothetical protein